MEKSEYELQIIREKMSKMMTGVPWRLWSVIRDKDVRYFKRKYALEKAEYSIKKIESRASKISKTGGDIGTKKYPPEERNSPAFYNSENAVHKNIAKLNSSMGKATQTEKEELDWVIDALRLALRSEAYERGSGIAEFLLVNINSLSDEQRKRATPIIMSQFLAIGNPEKAKEIYWKNVDVLDISDDLISLNTILFGGENVPSSLPSGKINSLKLADAMETNMRESEFSNEILSMSKNIKKNPQQQLLIANYYRNNETIYTSSINKFLKVYSMDLISEVDSYSFFETVSFDSSPKVTTGPLVSIIIAAYNAEDTIESAINSLLNQTYKNIEILIADDCSDDETIEKIRPYLENPKIKLFQSKSNQGCYNIRNNLIEKASGELITFQDSDDVSISNRIEIQVKEMLAGNLVACYGRWVRVLNDGKFIFFKDQAALRMSVVSLMFHRSVFKELGPYLKVRFGADTDYLEKIKKVYGEEAVGLVKRPLIFGRWSDSSLTQQAGQEASLDGYRGPKRRRFAEITFMQRLLGNEVISDTYMRAQLHQDGVLLEQHGLKRISNSEYSNQIETSVC